MGVGARGGWAALVLGALLVLALLKAAVDSAGLDGSPDTKQLVSPGNDSANSTGNNVTAGTSGRTDAPPRSTRAPSPRPGTHAVSTVRSIAGTPDNATSAAPASRSASSTPPASHSASPTPPASHSASPTPPPSRPAASASSPATVTATVDSKDRPGSRFDTGSFLGGIVLTLGVLSGLYFGCKTYYSRRGVRYRTIDEHDAII